MFRAAYGTSPRDYRNLPRRPAQGARIGS
ncbi:hypothetical protein LT493_32690 [Streptomyces tricolor]|nr:hypothetical protein [Streptomyces tricolor]